MTTQRSLRSSEVPALAFRTGVLALLIVLSIPVFTRGIIQLGDYAGFMHRPDLVIHEAGHVLFGLFGNELLTVLGGSLLQVLFPFAFFASFV